MRTADDRLTRQQWRIVIGVCIAAGAAYLQPATFNYIVTPMLVDLDGESHSAVLREVPSIATLLAIFLAAAAASRLGERRAVSGGAILVLVGSVLVAAAPTLVVVVLGLVVQSVGATVLVVVPLGVIGAAVSRDGPRATAFAVFSMVSPLAFVVLPVLTSALMLKLSWRVVAVIWVLGAVAALIAGRRVLAPARPEDRVRSELLTPTLAGVVCVGVVQAFSHGFSEGPTSVRTWVALVVAAVALSGLAVAVRHVSRPTLDVDVLRKGGVVVLLVVIALWGFTQLWYYMTLAYEYVFGLSVFVTALLMVPAQLCAAIGARSGGWIVTRIGITAAGVWLLVVTGVSLVMSVWIKADSPLWWPVLVTCLYSYAAVAAGVPMTKSLMDSASAGQEGGASAYRQAGISVGSAIGIAIISALVLSVFTRSLQVQLDDAGMESAQSNQVASALRTGASESAVSTQYAVPLQQVQTIDDAQKHAYLDGMASHGWAGALLSFATAGLFVVSRRQGLRGLKG